MHLHITLPRSLRYGSVFVVLLLFTVLVLSYTTVHAQVANTVASPCSKNACDLVDPTGRCDHPSLILGCADADYPKGGTYAAAPGSCESDEARLAVNHPIDRPSVLKNLTIDGTPKGKQVALVLLMYSDTCGTNWLEVILQGLCAAKNLRGSPCSVTGSLQRTSHDPRDGKATTQAGFFQVGPDGHTHTTMLYAAHVPVQGYVSIVYPGQGTTLTQTPSLLITQKGF